MHPHCTVRVPLLDIKFHSLLPTDSCLNSSQISEQSNAGVCNNKSRSMKPHFYVKLTLLHIKFHSFEPAAPAAQAAPAASVIHRIAASGIDLPPLLPFPIRAASGDWLEEAGVHGVVLTYRVHLRNPFLVLCLLCLYASLGEWCGSRVSRPRKGTFTIACRCSGVRWGQC